MTSRTAYLVCLCLLVSLSTQGSILQSLQQKTAAVKNTQPLTRIGGHLQTQQQLAQLKAVVDTIFSKYDTNRDNQLDFAEVKRYLTDSYGGSAPSDAQVSGFIQAADLNQDSKLSKSELLAFFQRTYF